MIGIARQYQEEDLEIETLWSAFRPDVYQITNRVGTDAIGIYEEYHESENHVGYVEKPDFELYAPETQPEDPDKILFLYIPVARKS